MGPTLKVPQTMTDWQCSVFAFDTAFANITTLSDMYGFAIAVFSMDPFVVAGTVYLSLKRALN